MNLWSSTNPTVPTTTIVGNPTPTTSGVPSTNPIQQPTLHTYHHTQPHAAHTTIVHLPQTPASYPTTTTSIEPSPSTLPTTTTTVTSDKIEEHLQQQQQQKTQQEKEQFEMGHPYDFVDSSGVRHAALHNYIFIENCSVVQCFQVITDVEQYPSFLPVYKSVQVLEKQKVKSHQPDDDDQVCIAQYTISTFFKSFSYQLKLNYHLRHDQQYAKVSWDQVGDGPFVFNRGSWELFARNNGTEAHYTFNVGFKYYVPSVVKNWVLNSVMKDSMESIKKRVQSLQSFSSPQYHTQQAHFPK